MWRYRWKRWVMSISNCSQRWSGISEHWAAMPDRTETWCPVDGRSSAEYGWTFEWQIPRKQRPSSSYPSAAGFQQPCWHYSLLQSSCSLYGPDSYLLGLHKTCNNIFYTCAPSALYTKIELTDRRPPPRPSIPQIRIRIDPDAALGSGTPIEHHYRPILIIS